MNKFLTIIILLLLFGFYHFNIRQDAHISETEYVSAGIKKDGIPSIDKPKFISIADSDFSDNEWIIGINYNGVTKAYPQSILNWHEIVNDSIDNLPIAVTYCPLCSTSSVFVRHVAHRKVSFGVSDKVYQSCLVMFDRESNTMWSQPNGMAIDGINTNRSLNRIPAIRTRLGLWKEKFPKSEILSRDTGFNRDYNVYPYGNYQFDNNLLFPARNSEKLNDHPKNLVTYLYEHTNDSTKFKPYSSLSLVVSFDDFVDHNNKSIYFGDKLIDINYDAKLNAIRFYDGKRELPAIVGYNFVYPAFFNGT